jgi:acyl carrier protein
MDVAIATVGEIRDWLIENLATYMERLPEDLDPTENLAKLGVDSMSMVVLGVSIEELFKFEIEQDFFRTCKTLDGVAVALHDRVHDPAEQEEEGAA